jgi:hypothetical protein
MRPAVGLVSAPSAALLHSRAVHFTGDVYAGVADAVNAGR